MIEISKKDLKKLYIKNGLYQSQIAKIYNVSQGTISLKLKEYKITKEDKKYRNNNKPWTDEQKEFLIENFGKMSYEEIGKSKKIRKTVSAVQQMALHQLNLGDPKKYDEYITKTTLIKKINISNWLINNWIDNYNLPVIKKNISIKREFYLIKISEFWTWLENNQNLIKWNKFKEGILGVEPEWTRAARKKFREKYPSKYGISYTNEDDKYIMSAYKAGISLEKIGESQGRSGDSINIRLQTIQAERRNTKWTDEGKEELKKLVAAGHTTKEIAEIMNKDYYIIKGARERYISKPKREKGL